MLKNYSQEPTQNTELDTFTVTSDEAVIFSGETSSTIATTEASTNPRVREDFTPVDLMFIGGLAVFGLAGAWANSRSRSKSDS